MPDHVKKILNGTYLEDKPYNDIVLHREREMRLNGLWAPDETTLIPLNTVDAVVTEEKEEQKQRGHCFTVVAMDTIKNNVGSLKRTAIANRGQRQLTQIPTIHKSQNVTQVGRCKKPEIVATELMRQMIREENDTSLQFPPTKSVNNP